MKVFYLPPPVLVAGGFFIFAQISELSKLGDQSKTLIMKKVGRNEPCPCGSGKKYKSCHMKSEEKQAGKSKTFMIGVIIALFIIAAALGLYFDSKSDGRGQAPPGKVWSEEHGHYH